MATVQNPDTSYNDPQHQSQQLQAQPSSLSNDDTSTPKQHLDVGNHTATSISQPRIVLDDPPASASVNQQPLSQPIAAHGGGMGHVGDSYAVGAPTTSEKLADNLVLSVTLVLAVLFWIMTLITQSIVTARRGNLTVGAAWFGLFLQLLLILLLSSLLFNPHTFLPPHHIQLSTLAALVLVFAAYAVERNIHDPPDPSQRALAAAWLLTIFVDLVWVMYFTAPPGSLIARVVENGRGPAVHPAALGAYTPGAGVGVGGGQSVVKGGLEGGANTGMTHTPMELAPLGPTPRHSAIRTASITQRSSGPGVADTSTEVSNLGVPTNGTGIGGGGSVVGSETGGRKSPWSFGGRDKEREREQAARAQQQQQALQQPVSPGGAQSDWAREMQSLPKAEALFGYTAAKEDPGELSFKKGEILYILDRSGKWWEARKADGTTGIAPSNYLRLVE
ncbi:hypothetical protein CC1G_05386 [Coprinopsis cinerea okayama7|uniref:SH3 domain-containing protein n=1 Tax=Coprinopsis cinerea (strain Okayama-7 / 130 / ATCC MYA-4618 / FGSC 9003) TaxID=240176 RepID=A8NPX1_COPC7|nr:hypothetical protein CC1G_05386 [Coprinopsis cinerea okayama7\|eukprot:XP_001835424.1 hypothetical protein CC1G_05386 [Coprinopsis cinerea okayama7\